MSPRANSGIRGEGLSSPLPSFQVLRFNYLPSEAYKVLLGCAWMLAVCVPAQADSADHPANVRSVLEARQEHVILQQFDLSCGAAALATLLRFQHGEPVSERDAAVGMMQRADYVANPLLVRLRFGFSLLDMRAFAERKGYRGVGLSGMQYADLTARAPAIVPVKLYGYNHFVVFRGAVGDTVLLADPAFGNRTMSVARFNKAWISYVDIGRVAFLVQRRDGLTPPNKLAPTAAEFALLH